MYVRTHIRTEGRIFVCTYHIQKTEKLYAPGIIRYGGIKIGVKNFFRDSWTFAENRFYNIFKNYK